MAQNLFGHLGAAGGHRNAARAEIPLDALQSELKTGEEIEDFFLSKIKAIRS